MFTIQPITERQIKHLAGKLSASGTTVESTSANTYHITGHGITAKATLDVDLGSLSVTVIEKPFYIPESAIQSGIEDALK